MKYTVSKRLFDLCGTLPGVLIISPLLLLAALLIWLDDRGPIFFRQERVGYQGKPFRMWKLRSMVVGAEQHGKQLTVGRDPRITRVGYWLRKMKLDELPQLFNVLAGEMSLVGPRPEVRRYVDRYTPEQRRVLEVMPGITDLASIKYCDENELLARAEDPSAPISRRSCPKRYRINLAYAASASVIKDALVIWQTFRRLLG